MAIEINNQTNSRRLNAREDLPVLNKATGNSSKPAADSASQPSDTVSLTETAAMMQKIQSKLEQQPVVDIARIESIKNAIASGSYPIDSGIVAEKMMSFERQLAKGV